MAQRTESSSSMAQKADKLWAIRRPADAAIAAVTQQEEEDSDCVAAIQYDKKKDWGDKKQHSGGSDYSSSGQGGSHSGGHSGRKLPKDVHGVLPPHEVWGRPPSSVMTWPPAGKLIGQTAGAVTTSPGPPGCLLLLVDKENNLSFLVDTGAGYSVLPHQ